MFVLALALHLLLCSFSDSCSIRNFEEEHFLPRSSSSKTISLQEPAGVHHLTHQLTCRLQDFSFFPLRTFAVSSRTFHQGCGN